MVRSHSFTTTESIKIPKTIILRAYYVRRKTLLILVCKQRRAHSNQILTILCKILYHFSFCRKFHFSRTLIISSYYITFYLKMKYDILLGTILEFYYLIFLTNILIGTFKTNIKYNNFRKLFCQKIYEQVI